MDPIDIFVTNNSHHSVFLVDGSRGYDVFDVVIPDGWVLSAVEFDNEHNSYAWGQPMADAWLEREEIELGQLGPVTVKVRVRWWYNGAGWVKYHLAVRATPPAPPAVIPRLNTHALVFSTVVKTTEEQSLQIQNDGPPIAVTWIAPAPFQVINPPATLGTGAVDITVRCAPEKKGMAKSDLVITMPGGIELRCLLCVNAQLPPPPLIQAKRTVFTELPLMAEKSSEEFSLPADAWTEKYGTPVPDDAVIDVLALQVPPKFFISDTDDVPTVDLTDGTGSKWPITDETYNLNPLANGGLIGRKLKAAWSAKFSDTTPVPASQADKPGVLKLLVCWTGTVDIPAK